MPRERRRKDDEIQETTAAIDHIERTLIELRRAMAANNRALQNSVNIPTAYERVAALLSAAEQMLPIASATLIKKRQARRNALRRSPRKPPC
jgi:hypothetical protein